MSCFNWFKCETCGALIREDEREARAYREVHYWLDDSPYEEMVDYYCPECGSDELEETCDPEEE